MTRPGAPACASFLAGVAPWMAGWGSMLGAVAAFAVGPALAAALVQLQPLMSVQPAPGVLFFAAVVVLTMVAVVSFVPRLIRDPDMTRGNHDA